MIHDWKLIDRKENNQSCKRRGRNAIGFNCFYSILCYCIELFHQKFNRYVKYVLYLK